MGYLPIENYGIIGDMRTVALIGMNGSIDWFCYPRFDSPSVFGAILDENKGGHFRISPAESDVIRKQFYWPETNVLITRFLGSSGVTEVTDYMPVSANSLQVSARQLVRRVHGIKGCLPMRVECFPAFNYARDPHDTRVSDDGASFHSPGLSLGLSSSVKLTRQGSGVSADFVLSEGRTAVFVLQEIPSGTTCGVSLSGSESQQAFIRTIEYWHDWISSCTYRGRWREMVHRSALVLKLLTCETSGAIVAAPTCSLPEAIAGERNWDYRYTWIRDAAFTLYGLMRIGFTKEAANFMSWIEARCHELTSDTGLQIMYGLDGRNELDEETLDHLEGYKGSRPVRVGNAAHNQTQLDIYGELMDSVYLYNKYGAPISYEIWTHLRHLANWVCGNWRRKDEGVWEVRAGQQDFVYSKLMCWVAVDRAIRLADKRSFPADKDRWVKTRDDIYEEIMSKGWSGQRRAFTQYYGSTVLDASILLMPLVFFISPTDPRMLDTLSAIMRPPSESGLLANNLVYRYNAAETPDGLVGEEGTFNICTFWLVEALTRAGKTKREHLEEARLVFERMLGYANHLGLYAEETGPRGEALGNFPQAFTHLSLISAAYNLDKALGGGS